MSACLNNNLNHLIVDLMFRRFTTHASRAHENPLGLPKSNAAPQMPRMQRGIPARRRLRDVGSVIAVSSAKGGVGKSTLAVNMALGFALRGQRAGILDADIFGPSVPRLMNLEGEPRLSAENKLLPLENYGVKSMSMGFLVGKDAPVVWRGLMVVKALQQLLHQVAWGGLDVLVVDMPPGTGDTQLTITQEIELDGAVIVSTPQDIALLDAVKGINMYRKVGVRVIGMVQNMSTFVCPKCGGSSDVFGHGGVEREASKAGVEMLGDVPLHASICTSSDNGKPIIIDSPDSPLAAAFRRIVEKTDHLLTKG